MKKLSKILFIFLSLVTVFSIAAVVAMAEKPTEPAIVKPASKHVIGTGNLSTLTDGAKLANDPSRIGSFSAKVADDGNVYALNEYEAATGNDREYWSFYPTYDRDTYGILNYKYYVLDYDLMSIDGTYEGVSIQADIWNGQKTIHYGSNISATTLGLSTTPYEWQHVTYVMEHAGDGLFIQHYYVNGEHVVSKNMTKANNETWLSLGGKYTNVIVGQVRFFSVKNSGTAVGYDNFRSAFFPENYTLDEIATDVYKDGYEFPYGRTEAKIGDSVFDDANEAILSAEEGDTVRLTMNATKTLTINKDILLDTNVYDSEGIPTGRLYTYEYKTTAGLVPTETETGSGIFRFTRSPNATDVIWDPICDGECDCYGGHALNAKEAFFKGDVPYYDHETPDDYIVEEGKVIRFAGWSYQNDGTPDRLVEISAADVNRGGVKLYPVYETVIYSFKVESEGSAVYYEANRFAEMLEAVEITDGVARTITMIGDAEVFDTVILKKATSENSVKIILDLNGHTLTKVDLLGNKYTYNSATSSYEASGTLASSGSYLFSIEAPNTSLSIISSAEEKGTILSCRANGTIYYKENGEIERYTAIAVNTLPLVSLNSAGGASVIISDVNLYSTAILNATGNKNAGSSITVNSCNYYASGTIDKTVYVESNANFSVKLKNSLFYYPENTKGTKQLVRLADTSSTAKYAVTIDSCDIIGMTNVECFSYSSSKPKIAPPEFTVTDSRLYGVSGNKYFTTYLGDGTVTECADTPYTSMLTSCVSITDTVAISYTLPESTVISVDSATKKPSPTKSTFDITLQYACSIRNTADVPESFTDVRLAMFYRSDFKMALYLPKKAEPTKVSISGFTSTGASAIIDGEKYTVYTGDFGITEVSESYEAHLTYKVDGKTYKQTFTVSALIYAEHALENAESDLETKAVANMVRFIKEARLASSLPAGAEFDELIALGDLEELGAKEDYIDGDVSFSALKGSVRSITLMLDGTKAAFLITLTSRDAEVSVRFVDGDELLLKKSSTATNAKYTYETMIYDIVEKDIEITVTVPKQGGTATVTSGTYSIASYIYATDNTLAKAAYEFGAAVKAYREQLKENA